MTAQHPPSPESLGPLTLSDWAEMPEDELVHTELQEGALLVMAKPSPSHQRAMMRLAAQLDALVPGGFEVFPEVDVVLAGEGPATIRAPDVVVVREGVDPARSIGASDVVIAIEIVSPSTSRMDAVVKAGEYAEARIPHYWIVQLDRSLTAFRLTSGGRYVEAVPRAIRTFRINDPFTLELDLGRL